MPLDGWPRVDRAPGSLLDDVAAGADWLAEMAIEDDLVWGGFFDGRDHGESAADAGRRLGSVIASYPEAVGHLFGLVMQRRPRGAWDREMLAAALAVNARSTDDFPTSSWHATVLKTRTQS